MDEGIRCMKCSLSHARERCWVPSLYQGTNPEYPNTNLWLTLLLITSIQHQWLILGPQLSPRQRISVVLVAVLLTLTMLTTVNVDKNTNNCQGCLLFEKTFMPNWWNCDTVDFFLALFKWILCSQQTFSTRNLTNHTV